MPEYSPNTPGEYVADLLNTHLDDNDEQMLLSASDIKFSNKLPTVAERIDELQGAEIRERLQHIDAELRRMKNLEAALIDAKQKIKGVLLSGILN